MDYVERAKRWTKGSYAVANIAFWLVQTVQGLGRLDVRLIAEDMEFLEELSYKEPSVASELMMNDRMTYSYLWVLGSYEVIRTLHQHVNQNESSFCSEVILAIGGVKKKFARLRMPLAKLEPAKSYQKSDSHIAYPVLNLEYGTAWQLGKSTFISRYELADAMLETLELMQNKRKENDS